MVRLNEIRAGEVAVAPPDAQDAGLVFIGRIRTPWTDRLGCPRQGRLDGPPCRIEVFAPWREALDGVTLYERLEVLYWLDRSRRDLVRQSPANDGTTRGTFSLRSPVRPNPIGTRAFSDEVDTGSSQKMRQTQRSRELRDCSAIVKGSSIVRLIGVEDGVVHVRGLDCLDGTPLLDIKPDRALFTPLAPPQAGDAETGAA